MGKNNARLYDVSPLIQAGIDPKTGLPIRMAENSERLKNDIKRQLRIRDEQDALHRYTWYNLPNGLSGELLERILFYRGQGIFFFMSSDQKFYFLPYALEGTIDVYGRYISVTPLPFNGKPQDGKEKAWITGLIKEVAYELETELNLDTFENKCVIIRDYANQMSETIIPRSVLQEPILEVMSEAFPMARTSLIANSGIKGMRVNSDDEAAQVKLASKSIEHAALTGDPWIPITAQVDFQDLTSGSSLQTNEYLEYFSALDNYRKSLYGIQTDGVFQKSQYQNNAQVGMGQGGASIPFEDGLYQRQKACDIINSIWGLGIWVEPNEAATGVDRNMDGYVGDEQDQSGAQEGEQPQEVSQDAE